MLLEMKLLYLAYGSKTKSISFEMFWTCLALSQISRLLTIIYPIIYNFFLTNLYKMFKFKYFLYFKIIPKRKVCELNNKIILLI